MNIQQAIAAVLDHRDLERDEMTSVMRQIMTGEATPAQIGGFLIGLRMKGETVDEITAAASVMRELATPVTVDKTHLVDIVGTGGDGAHTFNISTASTFVVAAAGGRVAKHGNRSVSSSSGAADLLEAAGVNLQLTPEQVGACIDEVGVGFMFAPQHHSAMKHAIGPRKEMAVRTIFNILGPLTNPAGAANQLMGVFHPDLVGIQVRVLQQLGAQHAMVVWGRDGMDEISLGASTLVGELRDGEVREYEIEPEDFGMAMASSRNLRVEGVEESRSMLLDALEGRHGVPHDIVCLNAGAALYTAGVAASIDDGIELARTTIASGAARAKMDTFVATSRRLADA